MSAPATRLRILEADLDALRASVLGVPKVEGAAYLLCQRAATDGQLTLLVREVLPVADADFLRREATGLSIRSDSYARAAKRASRDGASIIFVHSHPGGLPTHSQQDDAEEPELMAFFMSRVPGVPHGSLVTTETGTLSGRVWTGETWQAIEDTIVIGRKIRVVSDASHADEAVPMFFDRQVRAFGPDLQRLLSRLHVGIVGAGGTGSAVGEQLCRLGVGRLSVYDGDTIEESNVSRVYGSSVADVGENKATVLGRHLARLGLPGQVAVFPASINDEATARTLTGCDLIFGCTDRQLPRAILMALMTQYLVPVIDLGVLLASEGGTLTGVYGRVTTCYPGEACLFCRERISPAVIAQESRPREQQERLAGEGYAPELPGIEPAVVTFTTAVAAQAVTEMLHRLTGFMGSDRLSTEVLLLLHGTEVRRNRQRPGERCVCGRRDLRGRGDRTGAFLGLVWSD